MNEKALSIVFTGDIGFDHYMARKWEDDGLISDDVLAFFDSADHVVANIEGPLCSMEKQVVKHAVPQLMHVIDPAAETVLKKIHADIWNLDNNHIMDAGEEGLIRTLQEAERFGAKTIGAGRNIKEAAEPLFLEEAGGIGIFAVGYRRGCKPAGENRAGCLLWNDMDLIEENIKRIKATCRWCIMVAHGGEEFTSLPTPYTRDRYLSYLDMGADIIVCHHPHVPMNYETFPGKAIFYSLGNFIFDTPYQRAQFNTEKGLLLRICLTEDGFTFEPFGIEIDRNEEHVIQGKLPAIFEDVPEEEYRRLVPLAAKMFVAATKRQQIFLNPDKFTNADEAVWKEHFADPKRSGRVPGEALDFTIVCPLAEKENEKEWTLSRLDHVVNYILEQM